MRRFPASLLLLSACAASVDAPASTEAATSTEAETAGVSDDGSYLARIDPLGGQWQVERIGDADFARFKGWVGFSAGGFLNHGAGCGGGHPAFYRLDGGQIAITRIEPIRTGKCAGTQELANGPAALRAAAADSERRLAAFIDQLASWRREGDTLVLIARDGREAVLTQPREPHPEIAGRWLIESIGGKPLVTERRPAMLTIARGSIGAHADCNSIGGNFTVPSPGQIRVEGPLMSTAIGCAPEDHDEDELMTRAMSQAAAYRLSGERLVFSGGPGMVLRRPPAPNRQLAGEYEACGNTMLGAYHEGPITLVIGGDSIRDNAGCTARYRVNGPDLTLELEDSPACADSAPSFKPGEPVGVGGEISMLAVARPDGFAFNEQGQLVLRTGRGLLTMCRKGTPPPFGS